MQAALIIMHPFSVVVIPAVPDAPAALALLANWSMGLPNNRHPLKDMMAPQAESFVDTA
jgi:hypothetical protein